MHVFWLVVWIVVGSVALLDVGVICVLSCVVRSVKELVVVCWFLLLIVSRMESLVGVIIVSSWLKSII